MAKFRKKPVVIEAVTCSEVLQNAFGDRDVLPTWIVDAYDKSIFVFLPDCISISTLEGSMLAQRGDWIIRGVNGELYPCKPDIFEKTYEAVLE
jgi:hypothetical protein